MKTSNKILWGTMGCIFAAVLMAAIAMRVSSCSAFTLFPERVAGDGNIITQTQNLPYFDAVNISVAGKVVVKKGNKPSITIQDDQNLLPYIIINVEDKVLHIKVKDGFSLSSSGTPMFNIVTNNIKSFAASGRNQIVINNVSPQQFKLHLSGVGEVLVRNMVTRQTSIHISGKGQCELSGKTKNLNIKVSGKSEILAKNLVANNIVVAISGKSNMILHAVNSLDASISGKGNIQYYGNPTKFIQHVSGAGKIEKVENK